MTTLSDSPNSVKTTIDPVIVARCADNGITAYTAVQCFMALDIWNEAHAEYEAAGDEYYDKVVVPMREKYGYSTLEGIAATREDADFSERELMVLHISDKLDERCPLTSKMRNHSREAYPVDKTLRAAAAYKSAAKKVRALTTGRKAASRG